MLHRTPLSLAVAAAVFSLGSSAALAQFDHPDTDNILVAQVKPVVKFESIEHDMGLVLQNAKINFEFKFKNIGNGVLNVSRVQSTCGCTVPELEKKQYAPGENGVIKVEYNPAGKFGQQHKQIHFYSDDPENPDIALNVAANVEPVVLIEPRAVNFQGVNKGTGQSQNIKITGRTSDFAATLATVQRSDQFAVKILDTKTVHVNDKDLRETTIEFQILPTASVGRLQDAINIRTNDPAEPMVTVPISAVVTGDLKMEPAVLSFGPLKNNEPFQAEIKVTSKTGKPFKITKAEVKDPAFAPVKLDVTFTPADPANPTVYTVRASGVCPAQDKLAQPVQGQLVIFTDMDREEQIELPFYGQVRLGRPTTGPGSPTVPSTATPPAPKPAPAPAPSAGGH